MTKIYAEQVKESNFNKNAVLPYGLTWEHIKNAMSDFCEFLQFIDSELSKKGMPTYEGMMIPANFSSTVGEFMNLTIPKYCKNLSRNKYHNGHPDLVETDKYPNNSVQHSHEGIEIKASRRMNSWQGHNPEHIWLLVFVFEASTSEDSSRLLPFKFKLVCGAKLDESDWSFSGRREGSRRTITASVVKSGYEKMMKNWIYKDD